MAQSEEPNRTFSTDLLASFSSAKRHVVIEPKNDDQEIELSLGLSLNGRFGTDPRATITTKDKNSLFCDLSSLKRSSSISDFKSTRSDHVVEEPPESRLGRTCSLPAEAEDEWRRRKEIQSLRRLEAKRKRSEKQRNNNKVARLMVELPVVDSVSNGGGDRKDVVLRSQMSFQGSVGSHGSGCGSSGLSESDSLVAQGGQKCAAETRSPTSVHSPPDVASGDPKRAVAALNKTGSTEIMARTVLEEMPCVSTTGLGPEGKRIEGFLYGYRKGEEVKIVCVCHGSFLTPAEFVKHAGGGNVDHPLKHIVVNPTPFL